MHYYLKMGQSMEDDNSHGLMTHILTIDASQHYAKSTVSAHMCLVHAQYGNEWKAHAYTLGSCLHKRLFCFAESDITQQTLAYYSHCESFKTGMQTF